MFNKYNYKLSLYIPNDDLDILDDYASTNGLSRAEVVQDAIRVYARDDMEVYPSKGICKDAIFVGLCLGAELKELVEDIAVKRNISRAAIVRTCIYKYMDISKE